MKGFDSVKGKITLIQILLLCVVLICSVNVYKSHVQKTREEKEINSISEPESDITVQETNEPYSQSEPENIPEQGLENQEGDTEAKIKKYKDVYSQNSDMVGWIRVSDTRIDYPVMHNKQSNAYYLHRNIAKEYSSSGIPFMDYQCRGDGTDDNTIIYAHNMRNGSMFHDLLKYGDKNFYNTHKIIEFDTLKSFNKYEIFAVIRTKVGSEKEFKYYDFINAKTPAEFDKFISKCIRLSLYKTNVIPRYGENLLTLSTCSYNTDNERFVVFAKKLF